MPISKQTRKKIRGKLTPIADYFLAPLVYISAHVLLRIRKTGVHKLRVCKSILMRVGVFPVMDHYYEPLFNAKYLSQPLADMRSLPGIDLNTEQQLDLISRFKFSSELSDVPRHKSGKLEFYLDNGAFGPGDADYFYNIMRLFRPRRLIEIGSGKSTLLAIKAISANCEDNPEYKCDHHCIEPFAAPWLEKTSATIIRKKVEDMDSDFFSALQRNDILFIDSSHMIRPQGDVLFEYLQILPRLNPGVIVHVHDIFTPHDYPDDWVIEKVSFWNEQYLLEAFLSNNPEWKILGALNYLFKHHRDDFIKACPFSEDTRHPRSFYIQKQ